MSTPPFNAAGFRGYLRGYARAEGVPPLRIYSLRDCERLAEQASGTADLSPVVVDLPAAVRAIRKFVNGEWTAFDFDDWAHFVQDGFHPEQLPCTDEQHAAFETNPPLLLAKMAGLEVAFLPSDEGARRALEHVMMDICCLVEDVPEGQSEEPLRGLARGWLVEHAKGD